MQRLSINLSVDTKEAFTMGDCVIEPEQRYREKTGCAPPTHIIKSQNIWPEKAPWFRAGLYKYYEEILNVATRLIPIFALAFGVAKDALQDNFDFPITGMRALHYPPLPPDGDEHAIGLGAHADFSCKCR